jgi:glycine hydroxymethyltransferase
LVATGLHPNPVRLADVTTTSTHKTLCGPRTGGLVLTNDAGLADAIDAELFPGLQGAPGAHIIAGRAALFGIAGRPEFTDLMGRVVQNAQVLATALIGQGLQLYLGGTDTHMVLIDLRGGATDGHAVEKTLEAHGILASRVTLPARDQDASRTGIRLGTTAMSIRGFGAEAFMEMAGLIAEVLRASGRFSQSIADQVQQLAYAYPLPPDFLPVRFKDARGCRV